MPAKRCMVNPPTPRILFEGCPLCSGIDVRFLCTADCSKHALYNPIIPPSMTWLRCGDCEHVFTDGYFPADALRIIFERTHPHQQPGAGFEQQRMISARIVERVARYARNGDWLDVGFGNGSLLFTAEEWGFAPLGLDLRPSSVDAMKRLGIDARCGDLAAIDEPGRFSVVSLADVLEHMPFPRDRLTAAHQLLRPKGVLFVSMPNYGCAAWRLLDASQANPYWGELEHYHNFSRRRLYSLLEEHGFVPVHYGVSERYRACMEVIARRTDG
ncbi:MAG: class I SAM-dependent methyltransferase [Gammaproteobacteria bacterium]